MFHISVLFFFACCLPQIFYRCFKIFAYNGLKWKDANNRVLEIEWIWAREKRLELRLYYKLRILFIQSRWTTFIRPLLKYGYFLIKKQLKFKYFCCFPEILSSERVFLIRIGRAKFEVFYHIEMLLQRDLSSGCQQQVVCACCFCCAQMCVRFISSKQQKQQHQAWLPEHKNPTSLIIIFKETCSEKLAPACHKTGPTLSLSALSLFRNGTIGAQVFDHCQRHHENVNESYEPYFAGELCVCVCVFGWCESRGKEASQPNWNLFRESNDLH